MMAAQTQPLVISWMLSGYPSWWTTPILTKSSLQVAAPQEVGKHRHETPAIDCRWSTKWWRDGLRLQIEGQELLLNKTDGEGSVRNSWNSASHQLVQSYRMSLHVVSIIFPFSPSQVDQGCKINEFCETDRRCPGPRTSTPSLSPSIPGEFMKLRRANLLIPSFGGGLGDP